MYLPSAYRATVLASIPILCSCSADTSRLSVPTPVNHFQALSTSGPLPRYTEGKSRVPFVLTVFENTCKASGTIAVGTQHMLGQSCGRDLHPSWGVTDGEAEGCNIRMSAERYKPIPTINAVICDRTKKSNVRHLDGGLSDPEPDGSSTISYPKCLQSAMTFSMAIWVEVSTKGMKASASRSGLGHSIASVRTLLAEVC